MALFKMFNNIDSKNTTLPNTYTKGYMYYDVKDSIFYIDIDGTGGTTGTRQKINAWGAEKSLKDSLNQQIDKTYIKGISISDNKLSYTLGDGTSHTIEGTLGAVTGVKGSAETTYRTGQINLTPENIGAATSGHTHTTTITTDSGTSQLTLAFGTKYKLTAGGTNYIFTMPANPDTNTASAVDNILDGSNSGTAITYAPYTSQQAKLSFDTSTTNPTRTDRLNLNGYLYATKLYSGGKEVLTAHQSLSNYKTKQTAVSSATAETSTATTFVYSVTQNDNGEITVKTRPLPTYNNYTLPKATDGALGGIKTGYSASGKNYAIKVDTDGNAYVNVPWENTHQDISGKANLNSPAFTGTPTAPTAANGTNNTQIATTAFVMNAFTANDAMIFKGVLGTKSGMIETLPTTHSQGWTYKVGTAGTYAGQVCEVGDTIYCVADGTAANNAHWVILQTNVDGTVIGPAASTADHIATFTGTTGKVIKDSGFTIATSVPANAVFTDTKVTSAANHYTPSRDTNADKSASASGATAAWSIDVVKGITLQTDGKGHVTGVSVTSGKIPGNPNTDRYVNSASFTDDTSNSTTSPVKLTLTRAGSDTATVAASIPKVSASSAGVAPKGASVSSQSQSTKFLREDGTWATPSYTTNTWRGIQNNLTSDSTTDSLSAAQGKALKALIDGKTSNTGTVTSVAASGSGGITISGSPITTSGTLSIGLNLNTAINGLSEGSSTPVDADYYISQYVGGGTSTTTYHRRPMSALYDYVKGKLAVTNNTINLSRNTETTIATIAGTPIKIKLPASDNTWRGIQNNLTSDATDQSLSAAQGKALKALIDGKTSNTGTVTSVATGAGLTGGTITGTGTIKANLNSETSLGTLGTTSKLYAVGVDANGKLAVNVPWENSTYSLSGLGGIGSISASGTAPLTLSASKSGTTVTLTGSIDALSTSKAGYVSQAPNDATKFLRGDATWAKVSTDSLIRPNYLIGTNDPTIQTLINDNRANRLAFLPADQIIIEKTTDGGNTWVDAQVSDATKLSLFSQTRPSIQIPLLNGKKDIKCGLRITITAMKYNVPDGTAETSKYNYWNSTYVKSTERYSQLKEMYFWISSNTDAIKVKVERANGGQSTTWYTIFENNNYGMTGWSGNDYIRFNQGTFGGGTNQTWQPWNYRITLFTIGVNGSSTLSTSNTNDAQSIQEIRGYGDTYWVAGNNLASIDHLYTWDYLKNVSFPAAITATNFNGSLNGTADKAIKDESGNNIKASYASSFSISDHTITLKNKNGGSLGTVTVPDNNTTYTIATGDSNGQIKVTPSSGSAYNVSVKGLGNAAYKGVTDNSSATAVTNSDTNLITGRTLYNAGYVKSSGVTSITLKAGSGISLDTDNTAITSTGTRTISIKSSGVTNDMLAGSIANGKLANSKVTIAGNDVSLGGSLTADTLRTSLGLSNAMHFKGTTTTTMSDGLTTAAVTIGGSSYTPSAGDVVLYSDAEFVWTGSSWERLGRDSSFKTTQSAVSDPSASGTSTTFIKTISQDANGVITPTKASLPTASNSVAGITKLGASGGAATYEHTHGLSIATDSGTSSISLAANTKYKLTAGGTTYIFTTPPDNNTWRGVQNNLTSDATDQSLSAAQGKALKALIDGKTSNTGTVTSVATGVGLTGGTITGSGTIKVKLRSETALTNDSAAATETSGRVYPVAIDKSGYLAVNVPWTNVNSSYLTSHQTVSNKGATLAWGTSTTIATIGSTNINVSLPANPNSDTKNTAGSTDTSSKIFLIGATSQAANPQTYSDNQVYATNGQLDANKIRIAEQVSLVFNSTTNALDFVFA